MENRANYALVGLFATIVVIAAAVFVYWFSTAGREGEQRNYAVVFEGAVTGLASGTDVLFNGLRVGSVTNVGIDPEDPNQVVARISVAADAPVKADTQAILEIQGLTGGAYIQLLGGSPESPALVPAEGEAIAVLRGQPSDLQTILDGAGSIVESAESAFGRIDSFLTNNEERLSTTIANIENLSNSLAGFAAGAGQGDGVGGMVESLQQSIDSANATFGRIEALVAENAPSVTATLSSAERFAGILDQNAAGIDSFLAGLGETGDQIGPLTTDLRALSGDLRTLIDAVPAERLTASLEGLEETITSARSAVDTVETLLADNAGSFAASVTNIQLLSETTAANAEGLNAFLIGLGESGNQIGPITEDLRAVAGNLRELVEAVPPDRLSAGLDGLEQAIAAANQTFGSVDRLVSTNSASFSATLANAERISSTIVANDENLDAFLGSLSDVSAQIGPMTADIRALSSDLSAIAAAVSPEDLAATVTGLQSAVANANTVLASVNGILGQNGENLSATLENVEVFSTVLAANSSGVDTFLTSLAESSDEIAPLAQEIRLLTADLRGLVEVVPPEQVAQTFSDVSDFANSLARNTDNIDAFFVDAGTLAANLSGVSEGLQGTLNLIDEASGAIDAEIIANAMRNIDAFSVALGDNAENIDQILGNTRDLTETLSGAAERIDTIITRVDGLVATEGGESLFTDISAAALSIRTLADQLQVQTGEVAGAFTGFANTGLADYARLAEEARVAVQQLQRVLSEIERNPQVVIFGGDTVRDFER